jgi:sigma-E factor negative regulatory protein RseA
MSIMNAAHMNPKPSNIDESLSALVDGELEATALGGLLGGVKAEPQRLETWYSYQVIGDVLRGSGAAVTATAPGDFLADFRERLKAEAVVPEQAVVTRVEAAAPVAANDAVFRWKLVAGFASVAAVMAVTWNLVGVVPEGTGASGPQLASTTTAPPAPSAVVPAASQAPAVAPSAVAVNTGQGVLIRDARLEELLAEHRQHGGMSALQMPTGFIRGATYDASDR